MRRQQAEQRGATAVEYGLILGLIAAVIVVAVFLLGQATSAGLTDFQSSFEEVCEVC